jgi:hypothetical protein
MVLIDHRTARGLAYPRPRMPTPTTTLHRIRDAYQKRFGTLVTSRFAGTEDAPFFLLELRGADAGAYTYATFGASAGPLEHEIAIVAAEPFPPLGEALAAVARDAQALAPGGVVACAVPGTPFTALLILPADQDGSFSASVAAGAPLHVLVAAPLTAAERALAERDPGEARSRLRAAYALTADPHRACTVDLPPPPPAARTEIAARRREKRAAVLVLQGNVLREHGARGPSARSEQVRIPGCWPHRLLGAVEGMIYRALAPYAERHPAPVAYLFAEFLYVTFASHPDAVRLLDRALDPRDVPRLAAGDGGRQAAEASRRAVLGLAVAVARCHLREDAAALFARGQAAIPEVLATFDPGDEIPLENHVWAAALPVLYEGLEDLKPPAVRGLPRAFRLTARDELLLEYEPDPRPPLVRAGAIAARIATELVAAYADGLRRRGRPPS